MIHPRLGPAELHPQKVISEGFDCSRAASSHALSQPGSCDLNSYLLLPNLETTHTRVEILEGGE